MTREETIVKHLTDKFPYLEGKYQITRQRRIFVTATRDQHLEILAFLKDNDFNFLCTITGLDIADEYQIMYNLATMDGVMLNLKVNIPKSDPVISAIIGIYEGSLFYERELVDMFGIEARGLPAGRNYPLPEGWPKDQHPLRKDWKPEMLNQKQEVGQ
ncbi:MAG: NADH-quinone oxidoreductase subunit C [Candidatus Omnitrophota bacterium]